MLSFLLAIENGRLFCLPSENDFCCLRERNALHFDEIVQRRSAANALREPAPLAVADSQGVVLSGAIGVSGYMDELLGFIIAEVSQKVHFLGLGNILRSNIAHRASPRFTPVSQKIGPDDRIGSALDGVPDVVHVVGLPLFEVLEHICKRTGRLQERLALLIG